MWFRLHPVGLEYAGRSRSRIVNERVIRASPERVFDLLVDDTAFSRWLEDFVAVRWTSDPPHGNGSTRDVELRMLTAREQFLAWDRGARLTFHMTALTLPLARRLMEDIRLEPTGDGATRVIWTVHYDPRTWVRPIHPLVRFVFGRLFRKSLGNLGRLAEESSPVTRSREEQQTAPVSQVEPTG
ncbi:MAG: SRPBCC family protein [Deltaproteobacteria bacterium]|nr:SRPBCC family protein [Deltaproteobacteria bacterium]